MEGVPGISKLINQTPRIDLIAKALEKIIKSSKRNDLLRITAGILDIKNASSKPIEKIYVGRNIVVALTNLAETLEEVLRLKNASYKKLLDGPHKALDLFQKAYADLKSRDGKINLKSTEDIQWLRDSGIFGIFSFAAGIISFLGELSKNNSLAKLGRFVQTYTSDGDKFLSNNSDRNHCGFGFTIENFFANAIDMSKNKISEKATRILIAAQYAVSWASRTLAIRSQAAEHQDNLTKIYENPFQYCKEASFALLKALNPFNSQPLQRSTVSIRA